MIPILYEQTEKQFKSNGIGRLSDATSCIVHERRNESFDLDLTYPVCGKYARELRIGRIIYATHDRTGKPQPFDITSVSAESHGQVRVTAQHISQRLKGILTKLNRLWWTEGGTVKTFFEDLNDRSTDGYIIGDCDFTFHTDVTDENRSYSPRFSKFYSVYEHLMDKQYGLLSVENGVCPDAEYKFDMFDVWLLKARGTYRGAKIRTGANVKSLTEEETDKHLITGVLAFWNGNDPVTGKNRTISITGDMASVLDSSDFGKPEDILSSGVSLPYQKAETLDLSSKFSSPPTPEQVRAEAQFYLDQQNEYYSKGSSSYSVDLVCDTENTSSLQSVNLCDWVMVEDTNLRVQKKLQVTEVWFDTLRDRYTNMTVGLLPRTFKQLVHKESSPVNKKTDNVSTQVRDLASKTVVKQKSYPVGYDPAHPERWENTGQTLVDSQGREMEEIAEVNRHPVFVYKQSSSGGSKDSRTWFLVQDYHTSQFMKIYANIYEHNIFTRKNCNLTRIMMLQVRFFVDNPKPMERYGREISAQVLLDISDGTHDYQVPCTCTLKIKLQDKVDDYFWNYEAEMYNLSGVGESNSNELILVTQQREKYILAGKLQIDSGVSQ